METFSTRRITSESLEKIIGIPIKVLNKGFVRLCDYMGGDDSIVQAARVSYGKGTKTINDDRSLIRYLLRHKHTTPFEMCEIKFHIKAPIFIARQWIRHRTANINEYSARYSVLEEDYYIPDINQVKLQSESNKQGRGDSTSESLANEIIQDIIDISQKSFACYHKLLEVENKDGDKVGIAKELARVVLPLNVYTQFYWKIDLHNLLHFIKLRVDKHAQYEIRVYAQVLLDIVKDWVPHTFEAFSDYVVDSYDLSKKEQVLLQQVIKGEKVVQETSGLSKREWSIFKERFNLDA